MFLMLTSNRYMLNKNNCYSGVVFCLPEWTAHNGSNNTRQKTSIVAANFGRK